MSKKSSVVLRVPSRKIKLSEISQGAFAPPDKVELIRCGSFHHPQYGKFEITPDVLRSFKKNFDAHVRGIDLAVDYKHESEAEAAGWIKDVELAEADTSCWIAVDWTPAGAKRLGEKEFRYISADFQMDYKDNESLKSFGPTLMGAGLTNRPVIKRMEPVIELSETKGNGMDPKDQEIADLKKQLDDMKAAMQAKDVEMGEMKSKLEGVSGDKAKAEADAKAAAEKLACAEKTSKFDKLLSEGKVVEAQREAFMKDDMVKFSELSAPVKTSAKGSGEEPPPANDPKDASEAQDQILKLAEEKVKAGGAKDMPQAISLVLSEKPELKKKVYG